MVNKPLVFRALDCEDELINCPHEYSILVQICHYINRDAGYKAWLSQEKIRKKCRLSQSTLVRKIPTCQRDTSKLVRLTLAVVSQ